MWCLGTCRLSQFYAGLGAPTAAGTKAAEDKGKTRSDTLFFFLFFCRRGCNM
jgi:hypothetical protein